MGVLATAVVIVEAPAECASTATFSAALAAGSSRVRAGEGADRIEVRIGPHEGGAEGAISVVRGGVRSAERHIDGASCTEVVDGLALVAALAWDDAPVPPEAASPPVPSPTFVSMAPPDAPDAVTRPTARGPWSIGIAPSTGTTALGTDRAVVAWGGFLDVERAGRGFAPALRVGAVHAEGSFSQYGTQQDALAWTYARIQACPVAGVLGTFSVRPCAQADVGMLYDRSRVAYKSVTRTWFAPGVAARITWRSAHGIFVEVDPSFALAATRQPAASFGIAQYRAPLALPGLEIALGYRFF